MDKDFQQVELDSELEGHLKSNVRNLARMAIREDLGRGFDLTTCSLVGVESNGSAYVVARQGGVVAGLPLLETIIDELDARLRVDCIVNDAAEIEPGDQLTLVEGSARDLLTLERTLLNFIGRLSGIASLTRRYVDQVKTTNANIYDTRKTTPGWRLLEKYAVRCGGGRNHRLGLSEAVMIKDNHVAFAQQSQSIAACVQDCREKQPDAIIVVEVDTLEQLGEVLGVNPDIVVLDNMDAATMRQAVLLRDEHNPNVELEASGGVNLATVAAAAETGIDRISIGALTHSATCLDVALDWRS